MTTDELVNESKASGKIVFADHTNGLRFELMERSDFVDYKITKKGQLIHYLIGKGWQVALQEPE